MSEMVFFKALTYFYNVFWGFIVMYSLQLLRLDEYLMRFVFFQ